MRTTTLLVVLAATAGRGAWAADDEAVRKSREHYRKGEEAFSAGQFGDAYSEFEAGYALVPRPLFLLNMAHSDRRRGQLRNSRALYKRYLVMEPESKFRPEVEAVLQELDGAIAAEDAALAKQAATSLRPPTFTPPPPVIAPVIRVVDASRDRPPVHKRTVFWVAAAGVLLATIATGVLLSTGGGDSYQKSGSLGTLGMR